MKEKHPSHLLTLFKIDVLVFYSKPGKKLAWPLIVACSHFLLQIINPSFQKSRAVGTIWLIPAQAKP